MWRLDGSVCHLHTQQLVCEVDLLRPAAGLLNLSLQFGALSRPDLKILQVHTGETESESTLLDVFVRGTDLVATYAETAKREVRSQVYWRWTAVNEKAFAIDVILSVQTSKLDGRATLEVASMLPSSADRLTATEMSNGALNLFGVPASGCVYAEMAHPSNLAGSSLREPAPATDDWRLSHHFFAGRLEKGVIHRAMLRAMFLKSGESELVEQLFREFLQAPPPLST